MTGSSTAVAEDRVTDTKLSEVRHRLLNPLNDDGLRAWYPSDVSALLREVVVQRRIIAEALRICRGNPALEEDTDDLVTAVTRIGEKWAEVKRGVWAKAEVKRLQDRLADMERLQARLAATLEDTKRAAVQHQREQGERVAQAEALVAQAIDVLRA